MVECWEQWAVQKGILPWPWGSYTPPKPVEGNIVFHFPFDGNLTDRSVNKIELQNTTQNENFFSTDSVGVYGNALALSGEPDTFLEITRAELLNPATSDYTVCAWVKNKSDVSHHTEHIILHQAYNGAGATRYLLSCIGSGANGSDVLKVGTFIGGSRNLSVGQVPRNQWTHIAIVGTHANSKLRFYINGELDTEVTAKSFESSTQGFYVGKHRQVEKSTANWQGLLDDLCLFNIALDNAQLRAVMNGQGILNNKTELKEKKYKVYPVPSNREINIAGFDNIHKLSILSPEGKVMKEIYNSAIIPVNDLATGFYFLTIETSDNERFTDKVTIL